MFDTAKTGFIETIKISTILNSMGQLFDDNELKRLIEENDPDGEYRRRHFHVICVLCVHI